MTRKTLVLAALVAGMVLGIAATAGAGIPPLEYSPTSGPPGTVIEVSSEACGTPGNFEVVVVLSTPGEDGTEIASTTVPINQDGTWNATLTVPEGTAPGPYDLQAFCVELVEETGVGALEVDPPENTVATYATVLFTVTAQPAPPTTTVPLTPVTPEPPPAAAVGAAPAFTG